MLPRSGMPARLFNIRTLPIFFCPCCLPLYGLHGLSSPRRLMVCYSAMFHSHQCSNIHHPCGCKYPHHFVRKIQVTGLRRSRRLGLGSVNTWSRDVSHLDLQVYLLHREFVEPYVWLCKLPISGMSFQRVFPRAVLSIRLSSHDALLFYF